MNFDSAVTYFLPKHIRDQQTHPRYHEFRVIISSVLIGMPIMLLFPVFMLWMHRPVAGYLINDALLIILLLCIKFFSHYRIPMTTTAVVTYFIIYEWIRDTGMMYSPNVSILHMYLLAAIWADKKHGWYVIFSNLAILTYIYYQTVHTALPVATHALLGGQPYAFGMHCLITIFFGGFLAWQQYDQERDRAKIRSLQDQKISLLDEAVKKRTEQLNVMRENIATDFHDQTGNMLSAITRQATLLRLKTANHPELQPIVDSIIRNSNALYAGSKDFLWHLNHNSDDPQELFEYLTGYGQVYYNQFDIAFSSAAAGIPLQQLEASAALNIILIFKEAMTNVVRHANASEVSLIMHTVKQSICFSLQDNGKWKEADAAQDHHGLANIEKRCRKNNFTCSLEKMPAGTRIEIRVPAGTNHIVI